MYGKEPINRIVQLTTVKYSNKHVHLTLLALLVQSQHTHPIHLVFMQIIMILQEHIELFVINAMLEYCLVVKLKFLKV